MATKTFLKWQKVTHVFLFSRRSLKRFFSHFVTPQSLAKIKNACFRSSGSVIFFFQTCSQAMRPTRCIYIIMQRLRKLHLLCLPLLWKGLSSHNLYFSRILRIKECCNWSLAWKAFKIRWEILNLHFFISTKMACLFY